VYWSRGGPFEPESVPTSKGALRARQSTYTGCIDQVEGDIRFRVGERCRISGRECKWLVSNRDKKGNRILEVISFYHGRSGEPLLYLKTSLLPLKAVSADMGLQSESSRSVTMVGTIELCLDSESSTSSGLLALKP
jgi:hypothetical protein